MNSALLNPGDVLDGKYEILSKIGEGRSGVVYKARPVHLHYEVAIRVLANSEKNAKAHFVTEATKLSQFSHPAIVSIHDIGVSEKGNSYVVLDYVSGPTIDEVARTKLSVNQAVDLALAISSGIRACHIRSLMIHRCLKPSNVRVTNEKHWQSRVKILDLGMALWLDSDNRAIMPSAIIQAGMAQKSHRYTPPESIRQEQETKQCDQYAIAALLYLLLTGRDPFHDLEGDALVRAILNGDYIDPGLLRSDIPIDLRAVLARGLHTEPDRRFPSVEAFADASLPWVSDELRATYTGYFRTPDIPINQALLGPVSSCNPVAQQSITPRNVIPVTTPMPAREPDPPPPQAASKPSREPAPLRPQKLAREEDVAPSIKAPMAEQHASSHRHPSQKTRNLVPRSILAFVLTFVFGLLLGASITTALFMGYLLRKYLPSPPSPSPLSAPQPQAAAPPPPLPSPEPASQPAAPPVPESPKADPSRPTTAQGNEPSKKPQPSPAALRAAAMRNVEDGNLPRALRLAKLAADRGGGAPAYILVGRILTVQHDRIGAEAAFKHALRLDPKNDEAARHLELLRWQPLDRSQ